ncbi:unnamed protein product [Parnassius apollo]|uniref:(apollo) hypothetical protein n=1 Tax=Parnassius apollo TaxID=110799 RepID=A0A8S3X705_PARAO|nr:unnamed protein product [Parnassius apollo]
MKNTLQTNYKNKKSKKEKREFSDTVIGDKLVLKDLKVLSETNNFLVREMKNTNQRNVEYEKLKRDIQFFLNVTIFLKRLQAKKEFITQKEERKQKQYLFDTMKNLHKIFETEYCKGCEKDSTSPYSGPFQPFGRACRGFYQIIQALQKNCAFLVEYLHQNLNGQRQHGIPVHIKVLASLHFFGHGGYQTTVGPGQYLGLSQSAVSKCLQEVADAIITVLLNGMVLFPETEQERAENKQRFLQIAGFPSVLGLIDCSQISIVRPKDTALVPARLFFNRKGFYSLNCQFVCNAKMEIIHFNATFPESTHDAAVWQGSSLSQLLETNYVNGVSAGEWLLGDYGYAQLPWLMTPYADADENTPEARYNLAHTKTRVLI